MSSRASRGLRSWDWRIAPARRRSTACAAASSRRRWNGRVNRRITVNLAPAALRKEGSGFDLPISLAVLGATRQLPPERLVEHAAVGELALDGTIRPVSGTLAVAEGARRAGLRRLVCAAESAPEAALAGIEPVRRSASRRGRRVLPRTHRRAGLRADRRGRHRERRGSGSRRSARPGARQARARDRRSRLAQPPADGPSGNREDDARPATAGHSPDARARGGARGDAHPLRRPGCSLPDVRSFRCRPFALLTTGRLLRRSSGAGRARAPGRSHSHIEACCSWTSSRSSRAPSSSRYDSRSRTASSLSLASAGTRSSRRAFSSWEP